MRSLYFDLLADVVSSYDQTKTTVQGRCQTKTIDGDTAIGPPLNRFIDVQTDAAMTIATNGSTFSANSRIFTFSAETAGLAQIALHTVNQTTGATTYVGKIQFALPDTAATTHTYRGIYVIDSGTTGWKIFVATTGSVAINGGLFLINNVDLADFVPIGFPTIGFANANNQKAVYDLQDPANIGVGQLLTVPNGLVVDVANNRAYVHNGTSATHQYYVYDTSATPTYTVAAVTIDAGTDIVTDAGHTFVDNTPVVFTSLTGGAGLTAGTVYFVRNSILGTSYQLSTTSGGAAINITTNGTGNIGRAFGTTGALFVHKTGNLPALSGTLLTTGSEDYAFPGHTTNSGFACAHFATTSNLYLGRLSELTSGATTWPSLITVNLLGTSNQITAPTALYAVWSNTLDKAIYVTATSIFVMKSFTNNVIDRIFGGTNNRYLEGVVTDVVELQSLGPVSLNASGGWLSFAGVAIGRRGVFIADLRSDSLFDYSYVVTKVVSTSADKYRFITSLDKLFEYTGSLDCYYRTSGFGTVGGGWISIPFAEDLNTIATGSQIQFKIGFATLGLDTSIPAQLCEFILGFDALNDSSDYWEYSQDDSSSGNPTDIVFRLKKTFPSAVPTLRFFASDLTDVTVTDHNSVTHSARFSYSTDSGATYNPLGTIPNSVGTLVRYRYATPPGVDIRPSLKEL